LFTSPHLFVGLLEGTNQAECSYWKRYSQSMKS
jgi:hypothetical protein